MLPTFCPATSLAVMQRFCRFQAESGLNSDIAKVKRLTHRVTSARRPHDPSLLLATPIFCDAQEGFQCKMPCSVILG